MSNLDEYSRALTQPAEPRPARLLAIDDSSLIHQLLKVRLKPERLEVHHAYTGDEGLAKALELIPDVILVDIEMPGQNGFQVLHALKADPRTHDIPVIFVSGSCTTDQKVQGLEMGAIDFITKPFEPAELRARVRSALRMRQLIKMLAERAQIDALTGLWNRSYFDQRLEREISEALRHDHPLSVIFTDIDHFKDVNDKYGHTFGDNVLETFGEILSRGRGGDVACRYGGEEFLVIAPHATAEDAAGLAERYRQVMRTLCWEGHPGLVITSSFGVSDLDRAGSSDPEALISSADRALYAAKKAGRDCVRVAPPAQDQAGALFPQENSSAA